MILMASAFKARHLTINTKDDLAFEWISSKYPGLLYWDAYINKGENLKKTIGFWLAEKIFQYSDSNKDNGIAIDEFYEAYSLGTSVLGFPTVLSKDSASTIHKRFDKNKDSKLDMKEFLTAITVGFPIDGPYKYP